jgi:hypothetical protein
MYAGRRGTIASAEMGNIEDDFRWPMTGTSRKSPSYVQVRQAVQACSRQICVQPVYVELHSDIRLKQQARFMTTGYH